MFMATLFSVFLSCKKQRKGHEVELMAIIQLHEAQFLPKTCMVNGTWVREKSHDRIEANQVAVLVQVH